MVRVQLGELPALTLRGGGLFRFAEQIADSDVELICKVGDFLRREAALTLELLAEAAGVHADAVGDRLQCDALAPHQHVHAFADLGVKVARGGLSLGCLHSRDSTTNQTNATSTHREARTVLFVCYGAFMQTNKTDSSQLLRPSEAAALLGVTTRTLLRMSERGDVASLELPSGHRRYRYSDIDALIAD
ncbi:helix-turn-helix domain-containing protein [Microbacterium sorbitolivorans]|uniref:helix-turn-helix domain-containing protein n=1 Tax=Microbacterium sorbitolivorans TaxID=1867410 RepID=UPI0013B06AF8|nr:helix-turn-helix domain-containing protein [Microbacterium sorbitolivorans]